MRSEDYSLLLPLFWQPGYWAAKKRYEIYTNGIDLIPLTFMALGSPSPPRGRFRIASGMSNILTAFMTTQQKCDDCYNNSVFLSQLHSLLVGHGLLCKISHLHSFHIYYKCMPHLSMIVDGASHTHSPLTHGNRIAVTDVSDPHLNYYV